MLYFDKDNIYLIIKFILCLLLVTIMLSTPLVGFSDIVDMNQKPDTLLTFNVIQNQFPFNFSDIDSASIIDHDGQYKGLRIKLKPNSTEMFKRISEDAIGKVAILVINNKIVSSMVLKSVLGGDILIASITRGEAQDIINALNKQKSQLATQKLNS